MSDHQGQIILPAKVTRGPLFVSTVISYLLTYDAIDVMHNDNLAIALSVQIHVSMELIGTVRKQ